MMRKTSTCMRVPCCILLLLAGAATAAEIHVSPAGKAGADGSQAAPLATIAAAMQRAKAGDRVWLHAGTYREVVRPVRSGSATAPIVIGAWTPPGGTPDPVVVSAYDVVRADWTRHDGIVWKAVLPVTATSPSVGSGACRIDGTAQILARWPDGQAPVDFDRARKALATSATAAAVGGFGKGEATVEGKGDSDDLSLVTYRHPAFAGQAAGAWDGALIDVTPGHQWVTSDATVVASGDGWISFRYDTKTGTRGVRYVPVAGDPFFLCGHLRALDTAGEFLWDPTGQFGGAGTLYVATKDPAGPAAHQVELGARSEVINLSHRSWIIVQDIDAIGGRILCSAATTDCAILRVRLSEARTGRHAAGGNAVNLTGSRNLLEDCDIADTWGNGIASGANPFGVPEDQTVRNCVIRNCGGTGISLKLALRGEAIGNTVCMIGAHGIDVGTVGGHVMRNHVYLNGMSATDLALLNALGAGDMAGTEVAWNWVHDSRATAGVQAASGINLNGGKGIRLDGGDFGGPGSSHVTIHHNLVWNTNNGGIRIWGVQSGQLNRGAAKILVVANTVVNDDISFAGLADGDFGGIRIRGNLAQRIGSATTDGAANARVPKGSEVVGNRFILAAPTGNSSGDPQWVDPSAMDYRLRPGSPAIDAAPATPPWTDGFTGAAPDQGRSESGSDLDIAGASILAAQMSALVATRLDRRSIELSGFPAYRGLPRDAAVSVGGRPAAISGIWYDITSHRMRVRLTVPADLPAEADVVITRPGGRWTIASARQP
jgi:hypothetical protein